MQEKKNTIESFDNLKNPIKNLINLQNSVNQ